MGRWLEGRYSGPFEWDFARLGPDEIFPAYVHGLQFHPGWSPKCAGLSVKRFMGHYTSETGEDVEGVWSSTVPGKKIRESLCHKRIGCPLFDSRESRAMTGG